jgi:hypothetical protein
LISEGEKMETKSGIKALRLELSDSFIVHAALLWDEKDAILVDTVAACQIW